MVKIFVGNLNPKTKSDDLRSKFQKYGEVRECDVVNNFAFVHMNSESDAKDAISALHNTEVDGVKINVEMSHGKKDRGGGGPMRSRDDRRGGGGPRGGRDMPDRFRGPPRGYMGRPGGPGGPGGYPPPGGDRYSNGGGGGWDAPYGQPPMRSMDRGYGYPPNEDRYPAEPMRREPRGPTRDMPDAGYRMPPRDGPARDGMPPREPMGREPLPPPPSRDYRSPDAPAPRRYDGYDSYNNGYDRYREPAPAAVPPAPARGNDYYDNYGSYNSGPAAPGNYDYSDGRSNAPAQPPAAGYEGSYDYGSYNSNNYDYGRDSRSAQPPPARQGYNYAR